MPSYFIHVQYCYDYLVNQIPMGLLLYSHIPTALLAIGFSTYVLIRARNLPSVLLFAMCLSFGIWAAFDLSAWFSFLGSANTMFTWSLLDFIAVLMFFFGYYFLYTFVTGKDLPGWQKLLGTLAVLPSATIALLGLNLTNYNLDSCEAIENSSFTIFTYGAEVFFILATIGFVLSHYIRHKRSDERQRVLFAGAGILTLFIFFFTASFLVSNLADSNASLYAYNYLIYGLFGMPLFLIYLGYLIVRYHAFDLRIFGAQALVVALVALIGSEFAFVSTLSNRILVAITLVFTGMIGIVLVRSVRREIDQRERIEKLAKDLEQANKQQVALIHFITHQLKGFVAKSRNIFSMVLEGDYGPLSDTMRPVITEGFNSSTKGAETIQDILNAANIRSGAVTYANDPYDFKNLIVNVMKVLKPAADAKSLALSIEVPPDPVPVVGDQMQMENALRNLIDNSIKYTPKGSVTVTLTRAKDRVHLVVQDTGIGITPEDMQHLFTEGGHGKDSQKVNVDSTGFGLYIVKNIIEAHKGKVWAESDGTGKGSRFIVDIPSDRRSVPR